MWYRISFISAAFVLAVTLGASLSSAESSASITGRLIEDRNDDGLRDKDDPGAQTLVELEHLSGGRVDAVYSLFSDSDGRFEFEDVPRGEYTLVIWWEPGFVEPKSQNARLDVPVTVVLLVGQTMGQTFLLKPLPEGLVPYPVRSGGQAPAVGSLTVGGNGAAGLPSTGSGDTSGSGQSMAFIVLGLAISSSAFSLAAAGTRRSAI